MNKKVKLIIILILAVFLVGGFILFKKINNSNNQIVEDKREEVEVVSIDNIKDNEEQEKEKLDSNIVVIYFSATGNTKQIAEYIAEEVDSDIFEIIPKQKYTADDLDYGNENKRATREQKDKNARPEIENEIDVSEYDIIFLGYPIWWGDIPRIIQSFIEKTDLSGKTVIPFCTSGSSGISQSESTLKTYKNDITWIKGNRFSGNASRSDVKLWIDSLDIIK